MRKELITLKLFFNWYFVYCLFINFYTASRGYFRRHFLHYDNGFRIILGENPIKDYWIVHGFLIDYLQAFFLKYLETIGHLT